MASKITFASCDFGAVSPTGCSPPVLLRQRTFPLDTQSLKRSRSIADTYKGAPKNQVSLTLSHWDSVLQTVQFGKFELSVQSIMHVLYFFLIFGPYLTVSNIVCGL